MKEPIKWPDGPNRKERRRRLKMLRITYGYKPTQGAFGASSLDTANAVRRREYEYYKRMEKGQ